MIEFNDNLYPLSNIKYIKIDREKLSLTVYFLDGLKIFPLTHIYHDIKSLEKKVEELRGTKRKSLLG